MIKNIIFDFGDVFINLDKKGAMANALNLFGIEEFDQDMIATNVNYELGRINNVDFIDFYKNKFPFLNEAEIIDAWNFILKDFPMYRFEFLKTLRKDNKHRLILLSNTNTLHIDWVKSNVPFYENFKNSFDAFYLSQEIHLRKPDTDVFDFVLTENKIKANECLFIDDTKENTDAAESMGMNVWNIDETKEDVVNVFTTKKELF
jgi:putative hydrolase of the HAD superfamily